MIEPFSIHHAKLISVILGRLKVTMSGSTILRLIRKKAAYSYDRIGQFSMENRLFKANM